MPTWTLRHRRWVDAVRASNLPHEQLLIVDDGSPLLPTWTDAVVVTHNPGIKLTLHNPKPIVLYHFPDNLGRHAVWDFPGWHRSFAFAAHYAAECGFEKIIHIESDAFLVSARIVKYFADLTEGWVALYSTKYQFPEIALQVIAGSGVASFHRWAARPYSDLVNRCHETALLYTHVETGFIGDRYGEDLQYIPRDADYAAQVQIGRESSYYWWLFPADAPPLPAVNSLQAPLFISLAKPHAYPGVSGAGWAYPEDDYRWMIGPSSDLQLPAIDGDGPVLIEVEAVPHVWTDVLPAQRLTVQVNQLLLDTKLVRHLEILTYEVPRSALADGAPNLLRFLHPDHAPPSEVSGAADTRSLAIALRFVRISKIGQK